MTKPLRQIYQLKITLQGLRPPIWRRLQLVDTTTLPKFHTVLQIVMGWEDSHLHQFDCGDELYGLPDPYMGFDRVADERRVKLRSVLPEVGAKLIYEYDFGDSWRHLVQVEKILPFATDCTLPLCLTGRRACPPEDIGGPFGYQHALSALSDPTHPDHKAMQDWIAPDFDPEAFDLIAVNDQLSRLAK